MYFESNEMINENQAGFRTSHSTMDHIVSLKVLNDLMFQSKQKLYCAYVDYEKAFDIYSLKQSLQYLIIL